MASKRPVVPKRKPPANQGDSDFPILVGPTNIKPPSPQQLKKMQQLEQQKKRNVI